jgi:hypothetical protein
MRRQKQNIPYAHEKLTCNGYTSMQGVATSD